MLLHDPPPHSLQCTPPRLQQPCNFPEAGHAALQGTEVLQGIQAIDGGAVRHVQDLLSGHSQKQRSLQTLHGGTLRLKELPPMEIVAVVVPVYLSSSGSVATLKDLVVCLLEGQSKAPDLVVLVDDCSPRSEVAAVASECGGC